MAQGREEDKLSTLLVEVKMEDNLSDEAKAARAEIKKLRDGVDELLGEVSKGDAEFAALKSEIEQIRDPILRAEAAQKLLNRQYNRQLGFFDKLSDRHKAFIVDLKSQGTMGNVAAVGMQAAGAAVVALGAAVTAFAVDSTKVYLESNAETRIATDELSASFKGLQESMGEALIGPPEEAAEKIGRLSNAMKNLDKEVEANSEEIGEFVDGAVDVLIGAFEILTATTAAALTPLTLLADGVVNVAGFFLELVGIVGGPVANALAEMGVISDESAESLSALADEAEKTGEELGETFLTGDLWEARNAMVDFTDAVVDGTAPLTKFSDEVDVLDGRMIEFEATLERLAAMDAVTFLTELGDAAVGPLADGTEAPAKKKVRRGGGGKKTDPNLAFADAALEGVAAIEAKKTLEEAMAADDASRGIFFTDEDVEQINAASAALREVTLSLENLDEEFEKNFAEGQRAQEIAAFNRQFSEILVGGINDATSSMLDFTGAVLAGDVALSDMGSTAMGIVGDVFMTLGKGLLMASLGFEGLFSLNPAAMALGGVGLLAAGAVIKGAAQGGTEGAKSGTAQASTLLESVGREFADQEDAREASGGGTSIYIGPKEIRNFVVETVGDAQRRNEFAFTGSL